VRRCEAEARFISETSERLKKQILLTGSTIGTIRGYSEDVDIVVVGLGAFLPIKPYIIGLVGACLLYFFIGPSYWLILPALIASGSYFHSRHFIRFLLKRGLRKAGYSGTIKPASNDQIIERCLVSANTTS